MKSMINHKFKFSPRKILVKTAEDVNPWWYNFMKDTGMGVQNFYDFFQVGVLDFMWSATPIHIPVRNCEQIFIIVLFLYQIVV